MSRAKALVALLAALVASGCWEQVDKHWFTQMKDGPAVQALEEAPRLPPDESIARGKDQYEINCVVCHGTDGLSIPGPQNPVILKLMQNGAVVFPLAGIPAYTDGMIFYKIWYGKPNMPGYPQIPEEDRWHIVNYLRTLIKGAPQP